MKDFLIMRSSPVFMEISQDFLRAARNDNYAELPLERRPDGRLTAACREKIISGMGAFVNQKSFQPRPRVYCAISAAGVSLRRLSLPAVSNGEFQKVLRLQIEAEFPLSPDELAWGWRALENGTASKRDVLVAAARKEAVGEYTALLTECGLEPVFTLASLARNYLSPQPNGSHALLELGDKRPEWALFENGVPVAIRVLPSVNGPAILETVAKLPGAKTGGGKIYLSGASAEVTAQLTRVPAGFECMPLPMETGVSAAISGLKAMEPGSDGLLLLENRIQPAARAFNISSPEVKKWLALMAVLIGLLLFLPYAEALVMKPFLARKMDALKADSGRLAEIDRELDFLQSLKQNEPPYLDALYLLAKSAPPGARFDTLNMDRQGNIVMHGMMQTGQQVTDFRSKLIASGFFASVSVEEQTPAGQMRMNVRMTAQWKPVNARAGLSIAPTAEETEHAKTNAEASVSGMMFPPGAMNR